MSVVDKYLATHASPDTHLAGNVTGSYGYVVAIPCTKERFELIDGIAAAAEAVPARVLAIVVVNATTAADPSVHASNLELMARLRALHRGRHAVLDVSRSPPAWLCQLSALDVLVVDRASDGFRFPVGQGVGLARRIGCDIALSLQARGQVSSRWIHMSDADVELPIDYFRAADGLHGAALAYPFWHVVDDSLQGRALALYDLSLRYYVLGLRWAGSPYAFHTVGSTLAADGRAYAAVRGMPRRQAAEDFYLLNKLAKQGVVVRPNTAPIRIQQRASLRVPFGTGAATAAIAATLGAGRPFCLYAPQTFVQIRGLLRSLEHAIAEPDPRWSPELEPMLRSLGVIDAVESARSRTTTASAMRRRLLEWFDGFRTLKLVHALRNAKYPAVPWQAAIQAAPFLTPCRSSESVAQLRQRLYRLEESSPQLGAAAGEGGLRSPPATSRRPGGDRGASMS